MRCVTGSGDLNPTYACPWKAIPSTSVWILVTVGRSAVVVSIERASVRSLHGSLVLVQQRAVDAWNVGDPRVGCH